MEKMDNNIQEIAEKRYESRKTGTIRNVVQRATEFSDVILDKLIGKKEVSTNSLEKDVGKGENIPEL